MLLVSVLSPDRAIAISYSFTGRTPRDNRIRGAAYFGEEVVDLGQDDEQVQLRGAALVRSKEAADFIADELGHQVVWICNGLGGAGLVQNSRHVAATPAYLPREHFDLQTELISV
jgi:hypothetical protein